MNSRARAHWIESLIMLGLLSTFFTSSVNADYLDFIDDEKSNGGGDSSDDDAENSTNQRDNDEEELDPYRTGNLLFEDSDDELTEHHAGANGRGSHPTFLEQNFNIYFTHIYFRFPKF